MAEKLARRRWLNYSLRTLLLLMAVVAMILARWANRARDQRDAVATITAHYTYDRVEYDYQADAFRKMMSRGGAGGAGGSGGGGAGGGGFIAGTFDAKSLEPDVPWVPRRVEQALGKDYFYGVESVVFGEISGVGRIEKPTSESDRAAWRALAGLRSLQHLTSYLEPADDDLGSLAGLSKLTRVDLMICPDLTDKALANLAKIPNLETLSIAGGHFTPQGYLHLARLRKLKSLHLVSILNSTSQPRALGAVDVTDEDLARIATLVGLEELRLRTPLITDAGLSQLARLKRLKRLEINVKRPDDPPPVVEIGEIITNQFPPKVTEQGVQQLKEALPDCQIMSDWRPL